MLKVYQDTRTLIINQCCELGEGINSERCAHDNEKISLSEKLY